LTENTDSVDSEVRYDQEVSYRINAHFESKWRDYVMSAIYRKFVDFFNLSDQKYVCFVRKFEAKTKKEIAFYLFLGLLPGLIAYIFIYPLRELMMEWTGLSAHYVQLYVLVLMSAGWHMCVPFLMLRYKDGLSFKESLVYLGFARLDLKGLLLVFPILTILFTFLALPYVKYIYPPLFEWLNGFQAFHMGEWHVFYQGYYDPNFPLPLFLLGLIGNFIGEEIYFRGYLLRKVGRLKLDWLWIAILFQFYHMWQIPINWAYVPLAVIIPEEILVKLRKNIYGAILLHLFVNFLWGMINMYLVGVR